MNQNRKFTADEISKVQKGIVAYGGGFMKKLGELIALADEGNRNKIFETWGSEIEKYINAGEEWEKIGGKE